MKYTESELQKRIADAVAAQREKDAAIIRANAEEWKNTPMVRDALKAIAGVIQCQ